MLPVRAGRLDRAPHLSPDAALKRRVDAAAGDPVMDQRMEQATPAQGGPMARLRDKGLFRQAAHIGGEWIEGARTIAVTNPADGTLLGTVPDLGALETRGAIARAEAARPAWAALPAAERARLLRRWHDLIQDALEDLAIIMTAEQGKPLAESRAEIRYAASFVEWFAEEAKRAYGDVIPAPRAGAHILVLKQPVGVVGAITPWNFPAAMITRKCAPALAAGCPVVLKPSEFTPFSAFALVELAYRAGFPPGVLNILTGSAEAIGGELTSNGMVRKISFTGSTRVGKLLLAQSAGTVKKVSLELGGNAPLIVFDDADLELAVAGTIAAKFRNTGQTCICANRIYVQSALYERFAQRLSEEVSRLVVADGFAEGARQGPLINQAALDKVERHVADARQKGARVLTGGQRHEKGQTFFQPTVLADVTRDMLLNDEETFGPVAGLTRFDTEDEAIRLANDTEYGLAAYVFTRDLDRAWRVSEAVEAGMIGLNDGAISNEVAPFGGVKQSGLGREGSRYGMEEYLELKYLFIGSGRPPQ